MTDQEKIDIALGALRAWQNEDWDAVADAFTEDGVLEAAGGKPVVGRAAIRKVLDLMAVGLEHQDLQLLRVGVVDGKVVEQRKDVVVINGATGEIPTVGVLTIADGKIARWTDYVDRIMLREHKLAPAIPDPWPGYADGTESDEEKIAVALDMITAWEAQDWDRAASLFAEHGVLQSVMLEPIVGREAFRSRLEPMHEGLERMELHIKSVGVIEGAVVLERVDEFDMLGNHCELPVAGVLRIANGEVFEWLEYYDRRTMLKGMGAL